MTLMTFSAVSGALPSLSEEADGIETRQVDQASSAVIAVKLSDSGDLVVSAVLA